MRPSSFAFPFGRGIAPVSEEEEEEEEEEESRCRSPKSSNVSHADKDFEVDADGEGNATHDSIDAAWGRLFLFLPVVSLLASTTRVRDVHLMIGTSFLLRVSLLCVASKKRLWQIILLFCLSFFRRTRRKLKRVENWMFAFPH